MKKLYLVLENGKIFEGKAFGALGEIAGEIVFATSMTGYIETLTDPSYFGQIVVQTFPLIGNYGIIPADFESASSHMKAYIVREWCQEPSNFRCDDTLDIFLREKGIIGLYGIDTRQLTKIIREYGVMNAKIVTNIDNLDEILKETKLYKIVDAVKNVTCTASYVSNTINSKQKVVLMDFGAKENIRQELIKKGCEVIVVPSHTTCEEILALSPNGIMLSNGPGDPAENTEIIKQLSKLVSAKIPIFGICLGHQLLALSQGAQTVKLKYGHRGANQPVKELSTGKIYISSQNHGYAVDNESLPSHAKLSFINANDNTCEGIEYESLPIFTVQFHPEACGGPLDTAFLFDKFLNLMEGEKICH